MAVPKPILRLFAIPAVCLLLFLGLETWYQHEADRLAGSSDVPNVCSTYPVSQPVQDRCDSRARAAFAASASAAVLVLLIAVYLAINVLTARVWLGRLPFLTGCRWGYRIALWASAVAWIVFAAVLYPMTFLLTFMRFGGWYWIGMDNFLIGTFSLSAIAGLVGLLKRDPGFPIPEDVYFTGAGAAEKEQPQLFAAVRRLAESVRCGTPRNIVLGLDPAVLCTARRARVEGILLTGGTLYLSLPYLRLLSESELSSLATIALVPMQMVTEESEKWLLTTVKRWTHHRQRFQQAAFPVAGLPFTLLWYWLDLWGNWQVNLGAFAIRRAAVLTGRENVAAALSKAGSLSRRWPPFLKEMQASIRRSEAEAAQMNLSSMFASRMTELAGEFSKEAALNPWIAGLGVEAEEVKRRVADLQPSHGADWVAGADALEMNLSMAQIKRMVFLREPAGPAAGL